MKNVLLITCALVSLTAGAAAAVPGLNLGWDVCGGPSGSENRTFYCDTNLGTNTLLCSFVAPSGLTAATANEVVLDVQSESTALPAWWGLRFGLCRSAALTVSGDFTSSPSTCLDYWLGNGVAGSFTPVPVGNRLRINGLVALPAGDPAIRPIPQGVEVYSLKVIISNVRTTGPNACAGCGTGVCIVLNSIRVQLGASGGKFISAPAMRNWVTWQDGIQADCYAATPARMATWGSVKALYR